MYGGIYAISALGLVLTYTSSRVFNFAHGAIAFFVAYTYYWLNTEQGWPIVPAAVLAIGVVAPLMGFALWAVLFRHLTNVPPTVRLVSTIGLYVALPPFTLLIFGDDPVFRAPGIAPDPPHVYRPFDVAVNADDLAVLLSAAAVAILLTVVLRFTRYGLAVRATVDSPRMAGISGTNTAAVTAGSWMIGTTLAGLAGVLVSPVLGLEQSQFTLLLIASFAAVVVGRMTSLPLTVAGAMIIGLAQSLSVKYLPDTGILSRGIRPSIPFIVMIVCLLAYRGLGKEQFEADPSAGATAIDDAALAPPRPVGWQRFVRPLALVVVLIAIPFWLDDFWLGVVAQGLALAIAFLSYTVLTGEGGMLSLCQITFAGVGGVMTAQFATEVGMSVFVAVLLGGLVAVPFGLLVALPALRLGDLYLALATLGFGLLMDNLFFAQSRFDQLGAGVEVPRPLLGTIKFGNDTAFFYLLAVVFLVVALGVVALRRSTTGMTLAAMRSSEPASATLGISLVRTKLWTFGLSAFIAGIGGGLYASAIGRASIRSYLVLIGIIWLAIVVTWGVRSVVGALLAGISFTVIPVLVELHLPDSFGQVTPILFGLGAIMLARDPRGVVAQTLFRHRDRRLRRERARLARSQAAVAT